MRLRFLITNRVNPARPKITPDYINNVLTGKASPSGSITSDHIGLQHSFLAAETQGMKISLTQHGDQVPPWSHFCIYFNALLCPLQSLFLPMPYHLQPVTPTPTPNPTPFTLSISHRPLLPLQSHPLLLLALCPS